jgi:3-hydroxyisobutyrate dehydrogenase-like beta-hydroxyacid dehydrogenase
MLLGGPHASEFVSVGEVLGFSALRAYSDTVGRAAATKLCRSVIVKGLEALVTESMLAARAYGVEDDVLDSLGNIVPVADWPAYAAYLMSRSTDHGIRRAEEMDEAAATVAEAGVQPLMSRATARRQEWSGRLHVDAAGLGAGDLADLLSERARVMDGDAERDGART